MKTLQTITGRKIQIVSSNKKNRTFTIRTTAATYRTHPMTRDEFISAQNNTGNDWQQLLKGDDYYKISDKCL